MRLFWAVLLSFTIGAIAMWFYCRREEKVEDERMREVVKEIRDNLQTGITTYLRDSIPVQMDRIAEKIRLETVITNYFKEKQDETELYTPSQLDSAILAWYPIALGRYRSERTIGPNGRAEESDPVNK